MQTAPQDSPWRIVVMGVTGCGKTTVGIELAERLDCRFVDGDDLHPPDNVEKMRSGSPLTDTDRSPWLEAVRDVLVERAPVVVACSALRRPYRDLLRTAAGVRFVFLEIDRTTATARLDERPDHFMSAEMVDSQFGTLEPPGSGETDVVVVDATEPLVSVLETTVSRLRARR